MASLTDEQVIAKTSGAAKGKSLTDEEVMAKTGAPTAAEKPSLFSQAIKPITDIPGNVASEFQAGQKLVAESIPKSGDDFGNPLGTLAGGLREAFSPVTGAVKSIIGDPIRANLGTGRLGESVARTAEQATELFGGGPASKAMGVAGKAVTGAARSAQQKLMDAGVRLTPGQMVGGAVQRLEDKATVIPGVGDAIVSSRRRGLEDLNKAVYNAALKPIGEAFAGKDVGREGIGEVEKKLSGAYDKLKPQLTFRAGGEYNRDLLDLQGKVNRMSEPLQKQARSIYDNVVAVKMGKGGTMDGETFKQVESELGQLAANYRSSTVASERELGERITDMQGMMRAQLARANPALADQLNKINEGWAIFTRAQAAAANRGLSGGVFTPGDLLTAVKKMDKSVRKGAFARGDALLQDLADAAGEVLPSKVPTSGSIERLMMVGGGAELVNHPEWLAYLGLGAAPFTRPAVSALNAARKAGVPRTAASAYLGAVPAAVAGETAQDALNNRTPTDAALNP
jgi:hypothetical protein